MSMLYRTFLLATIACVALALTFAPVAGEPAISPLPRDLRISDAAVGVPVKPLDLTTGGYPLIVSNAPERLDSIQKAAAMYRTTIQQERFRVFYHHQNATKRPLKIGIALTNPSDSAGITDIYIARNSQRLPQRNRSTALPDPAAAGRNALKNWFASRVGQMQDQYLCALKPGQTKYILLSVPVGSTVAGMYDFAVRAKQHGASVPKLAVTVLAADAPPADPTALTVLPPGNGKVNWYRRGTFPHCDRYGRVEFDASRISCIDMAGPHEGRYCHLMQDEMEQATDDPKGLNPGNYGVIYNMLVDVRNPGPDKVRAHCLMSAAGGPGFSQITLDSEYKECPRPLGSYGSWIFRDIDLAPGRSDGFILEFSLPGGCSGAHRLIIWPERR